MRIKRKQSRVSNQHDRARHEETARCTWACRRLCVAQSCGKTRHCRTHRRIRWSAPLIRSLEAAEAVLSGASG
jgi:hypothetical protein